MFNTKYEFQGNTENCVLSTRKILLLVRSCQATRRSMRLCYCSFERKKKIFFFSFVFIPRSTTKSIDLARRPMMTSIYFALLFFHLRTVDANRSHNVVVFLPFSLCTTCSIAYQLYLSKKIALYHYIFL